MLSSARDSSRPFIGALHRLLIFTQSSYNVVSTTFLQIVVRSDALSLLYFSPLFFYTLKALDCSSCEYGNAGRGRKRRTTCFELRLNSVSAYIQPSQPRHVTQRLGLAEEPHTDRPSKWHSIARHVPGRTNKDCRKRWCATMASIVSKGGWSSEEDRKLLDAVEKHGTKCVASPFLFAEVLIISIVLDGPS